MTRILIALVMLAACATARSPTQYRNDTQMLLYTSSTKLDTCYLKALASNANAHGRITVNFIVEAKTGRVAKPTVDAQQSTAPQELMFCVLDAIDGLRLDPPDANEGRATFVYEFKRLVESS